MFIDSLFMELRVGQMELWPRGIQGVPNNECQNLVLWCKVFNEHHWHLETDHHYYKKTPTTIKSEVK